jgi:two-component system, OmpR family, phosphate regulon sensor histidine kinase PhoR
MWQIWFGVRRRVCAEFEPTLVRLAARRTTLLPALMLTVGFVIVGGLSMRTGLMGIAAAAIWAALWPYSEVAGPARAAGPQSATESKRVWRMVIDAAPDPAVALDGAGEILHTNAMADDIFGTRRRSSHVANMTRDPELLAAVDQALATRQTCAVELHERVPVERRLLATVAPLAWQASVDEPALLISFRDLSEQDRLARMRADFVANASHELRTPLASLRGFVETLQGAARDDVQARERFLKVMNEQAERMTRLIDDLLSLSRVEMREHLPPHQRVDLNEAVAHVIQTLQPLVASAATTIDFKPSPGGPAMVRGERDELVQVFQNLIQNAVKYGKPGGQIRVAIAREAAGGPGQTARFSVAVSDDGPGIAPQHLPRLTERFYRVSVAASREKGGTGLGLAIVKHILNRHRGELLISSRVGEGSTFAVVLPAVAT